MNNQEPFSLEITNASPTAKKFYLSQGLLYTRGFETAGQLRTGSFPAIGEGSTRSLHARTSNPISIEQFIAYMQNNPTYMYQIQATSSAPNAQLGGIVQIQRQGMIKNSSPTIIPNRQMASGNQFNLQFQTYKAPKMFSAEDVAIVSVAGNSTLSLYLYPMVSKSNSAELMAGFIGPVQCIQPQCLVAPCPQICTPSNPVPGMANPTEVKKYRFKNSISARGSAANNPGLMLTKDFLTGGIFDGIASPPCSGYDVRCAAPTVTIRTTGGTDDTDKPYSGASEFKVNADLVEEVKVKQAGMGSNSIMPLVFIGAFLILIMFIINSD